MNLSKLFKAINNGDHYILYVINKRIKCSLLDRIMPKITHLGSLTASIIISLIMIGLDYLRILTAGLSVVISLIISQIIIHSIKIIVNRPRPNKVLTDINTFQIKLYNYSFPSGHTTAIFAISMTLSLLIASSVITLALIFIATVVGVSRIYIGVHYPTDVMIGATIGFCTSSYVSGYLMTIGGII